jgi:hypothetical protein
MTGLSVCALLCTDCKIEQMGLNPNAPSEARKVKKIVQAMDEDGSGALDIDEFWTWWKHHLGDRMALCDRPLVRSPDVSLLSWHAEHLSLCVC